VISNIAYYANQEEWLKESVPNGRYVLLIAEHTFFDVGLIPEGIECYGAIFPYVIYNKNHYDKGIVAVRLSEDVNVTFVEKMDSVELEMFADDGSSDAMFVVVDGLSPHIVKFLEKLFEIAPVNASIIGGGGGKLTLQQEPIIIANGQMYQDAALIISSNASLSLGVSHGWEELRGPFMATKTEKNILEAINYKSAFEMYKDIILSDCGETITKDNFFDIAKSYPLGINKYGTEMIVRDPIATDGESLVLVGEMEQNSIISVLKGNPHSLIDAARNAAQVAGGEDCKEASSLLVVDCVSRALFLDKQFKEELESISSAFCENATQWGVLSLGEIANNNSGNIEFYNKTCVVGAV
jgi:hypothetical protein